MHNNVKESIDSIVGSDPIFTTESQRKILIHIESKVKKKAPLYYLKPIFTSLGVVTILMIGTVLLLNILNDNNQIAESPVNPIPENEPGSNGELPNGYSNKENENDLINENRDLIEEYAAIINIFQDYELPTEGIVKKELNVVYYENGYQFHIPTKQFVSVEYDPEVGPVEPTEDQILGVILGLTANLKAEIDMETSLQWAPLGFIKLELERLYKVKQYSEDYVPIKVWADDTISYLEDSQALLDSDKEEAYQNIEKAIKLINDFHTAAQLANMDNFELPEKENNDSLENNTVEISEYNSMVEWVQDMKKVLGSETPENWDEESYQFHLGEVSVVYSNYYLERTTDEGTIQKLTKIKEKAIDIVYEIDPAKRQELLEDLYYLYDN